MTTTLERRLGAVEMRIGVSKELLAALSDLDLLGALQFVREWLAERGSVDAGAALATEDAEEAQLRSYYERPDVAARGKPMLEEGVRWPYLRARARSGEERPHYRGPRSALTKVELQQKINAVFATLRARP